MKGRPFRERLGFALSGLRAAWAREASFRTHLGFAAAVLIALLALRPAPIWWALVAITVALVLALELLNGAIEGVIDRLHPDHHREIGIAKDMLAGAVLVAALAALGVAGAVVVDTLEIFR
ncbi:diacylglycerol kinase [Sphingomonas sp. Leaf407]|uniref:diacylglycerol kinase n=1 Tax=unclassified Sphingomonas TaxID=196159 RepID=UPI0006F2A831|nr:MULTISPECIES: diacylglycerol kinase [unclassified Sphingomonas]KQN40371.1 diacylglycerol kinase [Sphingomonas sp. Leaf42]KQT29725.1 diacylglycerol kinase [Sphingomonas sp. Leaf407]